MIARSAMLRLAFIMSLALGSWVLFIGIIRLVEFQF